MKRGYREKKEPHTGKTNDIKGRATNPMRHINDYTFFGFGTHLLPASRQLKGFCEHHGNKGSHILIREGGCRNLALPSMNVSLRGQKT